jgi:hypothetical protein
MLFEDATLIRLADPATQAALFDQIALEQLVNAAYDVSATPIGGPFSAVFEELRLGVPVLPVSVADGTWGLQSTSERSTACFQIAGLGGTALTIDAFWRGFLVARTSAPASRIVDVFTNWPSTGQVDDEIGSAFNGLPANPAQLEQERRNRLIAKLKAGMSDADALSDAAFDAILRRLGVQNVNELFEEHQGVSLTEVVKVVIEEKPAPPPSPKALPIVAAVLIRDAIASLAKMLVDSRFIRERLEAEGMGRPEMPGFRVRQSVLVVWITADSVFDDDGWPGALAGDAPAVKRVRRRVAAGPWLAREGIGLNLQGA